MEVSTIGFKGRTLVLIASVPVRCLPSTFCQIEMMILNHFIVPPSQFQYLCGVYDTDSLA